FSGGLARAAGENVGPHAITQGTLGLSSNYALTVIGSNLTIGPKAASVTASNQSKPYGNLLTPAGTEFTTSGFINGDAVTGVSLSSSGYAASATAGGSPYVITPSSAVGSGLGN